MAVMQAQIQALLAAAGGAGGAGGAATGSNVGSHMEVAKPAIFNGEAGRVGGFIMACRLYIKMKLRGNTTEEQVQWALTYVQGGSADVWKENVMDEIEAGEVEFESVEEFFTCLKKEFGGGEEVSLDWSRFSVEEELRGLSDVEKVEKMGLIKIIMENNIKLLEMQKTINKIKRRKKEEGRREEERRIREREREE